MNRAQSGQLQNLRRTSSFMLTPPVIREISTRIVVEGRLFGRRLEDTRSWQYFLIANLVEILPGLVPIGGEGNT
jgi:hypothetical protein